MGKAQHTPGPWVKYSTYRDQNGVWHCNVAANGYPAIRASGRTEKECEGNGRLAELAPELFDLVEIAFNYMSCIHPAAIESVNKASENGLDKCFERMRSVITKMEGK